MRWIAVKDKLPEENKKVLLFLKNEAGKEVMVVGYLYTSKRKDFWGDIQYQNEFSAYGGDDIPEFLRKEYVIAWQSLPEPYKEELL